MSRNAKSIRITAYLISAVIFLTIVLSGCNGDKTPTTSETDIKPNVIAYPAPEEYPQTDVKYILKVNGQDVGVYSVNNSWQKAINFATFELREGKTATVEVTPLFKYNTYKILPDKYGIKSDRNENSIRFEISDPKAKLSFVFDDNYKNTTFHLFLNPIDDNAPTESTDDIIYYGPGFHKLRNNITLDSGQTLYIANGAVVSGHVDISYVDDITVKGGGIILRDETSVGDSQGITMFQSNNVDISGVIVNIHKTKEWTLSMRRCNNISITNLKTVSPQWASTDGIDICNSQDVTVTDCFLRATDDCITIKGRPEGFEEIGDQPSNERIKVKSCILWNECNNAMVVGEETQARYYKDISFEDIDVIYSYDDIFYHESLYERAAISIININGADMENILWDNIRVNECERLICLAFIDEGYEGVIDELECQVLPGNMKNVTIKNVTSTSTSDGIYANQIFLKGWNEDKKIINLNLENILINGEKLTEESPLIVKNEFVENMSVK